MSQEIDGLTQEELFRAELMSLRVMLTLFLGRVLHQSPDKGRAIEEISQQFRQLVGQIDLVQIPKNRHDSFRKVLLDRGIELVSKSGDMTFRRLN